MATEVETRRVESLEELQYTYDGVQLDGPDERPLIQDFLIMLSGFYIIE